MVTDTRSPARSRSARAASIPATPPPTITTLKGWWSREVIASSLGCAWSPASRTIPHGYCGELLSARGSGSLRLFVLGERNPHPGDGPDADPDPVSLGADRPRPEVESVQPGDVMWPGDLGGNALDDHTPGNPIGEVRPVDLK